MIAPTGDDGPNVEAVIELVLHGELPPATRRPCNECPWRRDSVPGHLGPHTASEWTEMAHGEAPIMCHLTIRHDHHDFDDPELRQCRGAATFRANVLKAPRNPTAEVGPVDHGTVFGSNAEFVAHHEASECNSAKPLDVQAHFGIIEPHPYGENVYDWTYSVRTREGLDQWAAADELVAHGCSVDEAFKVLGWARMAAPGSEP